MQRTRSYARAYQKAAMNGTSLGGFGFVGHPTKLMEGAAHEAQIVHALVAWPSVSRLAKPRYQRRIRAEHLCRNLCGAISAISDRGAIPGRGGTTVCRPTGRRRAAAHCARTHRRREPPK